MMRQPQNVANGRRLATRRMVMTKFTAYTAQVWRKHIIYGNNADKPTDALSFEALQLSKQDEPHYEYRYLCLASVLLHHFNGGYVHDNNSVNQFNDFSIPALIELYVDDENLSQRELILNQPDIELEIGDLLAVELASEIIIYMEVVGISGQSLVSDFGKSYMLNQRDDLNKGLFES